MEIVVALIMYLNGTMIEHTYKENMSSCLRSKRIAMREINPDSVVFSCKKVSKTFKIIILIVFVVLVAITFVYG